MQYQQPPTQHQQVDPPRKQVQQYQQPYGQPLACAGPFPHLQPYRKLHCYGQRHPQPQQISYGCPHRCGPGRPDAHPQQLPPYAIGRPHPHLQPMTYKHPHPGAVPRPFAYPQQLPPYAIGRPHPHLHPMTYKHPAPSAVLRPFASPQPLPPNVTGRPHPHLHPMTYDHPAPGAVLRPFASPQPLPPNATGRRHPHLQPMTYKHPAPGAVPRPFASPQPLPPYATGRPHPHLQPMTYKHPHPDAVLRPFTNYLQPCRQVQFIPISGGKSAELQRQGLRGVETVGRITEPEFPQAEVPNEVWSAVNETPKEQKKQKVLETFHFFEKEETSNNFASLSPGEVLDVHLDGVRDGATTEAIARLSLLTPEAVSDLCLSPGRCLGNVPRLQRLLQLISLLPSCTKIRAMMVEGMKRRVCDLKPVEITHSSLRSLSLKHATQIGETLGHLGGTEAAAFVNSALVGSVGGEALYLMTSLAVSFLKNLPVPAVRSPQVTPLLRTAKALEQSKNLRLRIKMPITSFFAEVEVVMLYSEDWPESRAVRDSIVKGTPDFKQNQPTSALPPFNVERPPPPHTELAPFPLDEAPGSDSHIVESPLVLDGPDAAFIDEVERLRRDLLDQEAKETGETGKSVSLRTAAVNSFRQQRRKKNIQILTEYLHETYRLGERPPIPTHASSLFKTIEGLAREREEAAELSGDSTAMSSTDVQKEPSLPIPSASSGHFNSQSIVVHHKRAADAGLGCCAASSASWGR